MITKRIIQPADIMTLVPHWPQLDAGKLARISTRTTKRATVPNGRGGHAVGDVLDVPPILTAPSILVPGGRTILNGKHRAAIAVVKGYALVEVFARLRSDILHGVKRECFGDLLPKQVEQTFDDRARYEAYCEVNGAATMADLVRKERELIRSLVIVSHPELSPVTLEEDELTS